MTKNKPHPKVDEYLNQVQQWQQELSTLRAILLDCPLSEAFKWRAPCYTFEGRNVVILGPWKRSCTLSFFKGALLKDPQGLLEKPGENSRATRVIPFTDVETIVQNKAVIKAYVQEAIELEKAGMKVDFSQNRELDHPAELQDRFGENPEFRRAFESLTPGRQRGYLLHFTAAKQSKTRQARIEKYEPRILDGKGLNDCTCGLSKKMPGCDGSHNRGR